MGLFARMPRVAGGRPTPLARLVWALFAVSGVGQTAIVPLLPRLARAHGLSASATALVLALPGLAMLAVSLPAGVAADRFGSRRVTLAAGGLMIVAALAQALPSLALLLAGRVAFGLGLGILWTAGVAWLGEMSEAAAGRRVGPAVVWSSIGTLVGPALAGLLAQRAGVGLPFVVIAAGGAVVVAAVARCPGPRGGVRRAPEGDGRGRGSLRALAGEVRHPRVAAAAGALVVAGALSGGTQLLIARGLHDDHLSTGAIGLAFSACAVGYVVASAVVVRLGDRMSTPGATAVMTGLGAFSLLPALFGGGPAALLAALMLTAVPRGAINVIGYALPGRAAGSVFGLLNGAWGGATVLMPLAAGVLVQHAGPRAGYLAVIVPAAGIAVALAAACLRELEIEPDASRLLEASQG